MFSLLNSDKNVMSFFFLKFDEFSPKKKEYTTKYSFLFFAFVQILPDHVH